MVHNAYYENVWKRSKKCQDYGNLVCNAYWENLWKRWKRCQACYKLNIEPQMGLGPMIGFSIRYNLTLPFLHAAAACCVPVWLSARMRGGGRVCAPCSACAPPGDSGGAVLLGDLRRSVSPYCRGLTVQRNKNIKISVIFWVSIFWHNNK